MTTNLLTKELLNSLLNESIVPGFAHGREIKTGVELAGTTFEYEEHNHLFESISITSSLPFDLEALITFGERLKSRWHHFDVYKMQLYIPNPRNEVVIFDSSHIMVDPPKKNVGTYHFKGPKYLIERFEPNRFFRRKIGPLDFVETIQKIHNNCPYAGFVLNCGALHIGSGIPFSHNVPQSNYDTNLMNAKNVKETSLSTAQSYCHLRYTSPFNDILFKDFQFILTNVYGLDLKKASWEVVGTKKQLLGTSVAHEGYR